MKRLISFIVITLFLSSIALYAQERKVRSEYIYSVSMLKDGPAADFVKAEKGLYFSLSFCVDGVYTGLYSKDALYGLYRLGEGQETGESEFTFQGFNENSGKKVEIIMADLTIDRNTPIFYISILDGGKKMILLCNKFEYREYK